jgi:hypothetical protein
MKTTRRLYKSVLPLFSLGLLLLLLGSASREDKSRPSYRRYHLAVLTHEIDPDLIPKRFTADFDEDGEIDQVIKTDTSLQVVLSGGGEFQYTVTDSPGDSGKRICDVDIMSLNRDGRYPSIMLATRERSGGRFQALTQEILQNDSGTFVLKHLGAYPWTRDGTVGEGAYPMKAEGLDCAWIQSNDLPVCFYASSHDEVMGMSRLIEFDVSGYQRLVTDPVLRSYYSWRMARKWEVFRRIGMDSAWLAEISSARDLARDWFGLDSTAMDRILTEHIPGHEGSVADTILAVSDWIEQSSPREQARMYLTSMDSQMFDSLLSANEVHEGDSAVDLFLSVVLARLEQEAVFSRDITREYHLPWPNQIGHNGPGRDGYHMVDAAFVDFSGDGLLDLVAVGQHSRVFSAIQHKDGYFIEAGFHSEPDEYVRVWAPRVPRATELVIPPCVYYGMEKEEGFRSDFVECYDRQAKEWYDLTLPEGPYCMERDPVMFWDMNDDGMIDFAARREDGSWNLLTFVQK